MKNLLKRVKSRPTVFHIGGILALIYAIPMLFYSCTLGGGNDLSGFGYIELIFISLVIILIDLMIPKSMNIWYVNIKEAIIFALAFYFITNR